VDLHLLLFAGFDRRTESLDLHRLVPVKEQLL
jgi:hypothetical protein